MITARRNITLERGASASPKRQPVKCEWRRARAAAREIGSRAKVTVRTKQALDPRNAATALRRMRASLECQRRFDEARRELEQVAQYHTRRHDVTLVEKPGIAQAQGDLKGAAALLDPLPLSNSNVREARCYQALLERNPYRIILQTQRDTFDEQLRWIRATEPRRAFWLGWLEEVMGDHAAALENWRQARSELEQQLPGRMLDNFLTRYLALPNAALGDKTAALDLAERRHESRLKRCRTSVAVWSDANRRSPEPRVEQNPH